MLRDFTAIDFETANRYPTSACSIGIVVVQDGEITEEFSHLIKPEPYYFNKKFIEIHGITPVMVKDAPSFYKLNTLCDHFGIALNHHEALSDARGAAKIMIELSKLSLF